MQPASMKSLEDSEPVAPSQILTEEILDQSKNNVPYQLSNQQDVPKYYKYLQRLSKVNKSDDLSPEEKKCPKKPESGINSDLKDRSTCPWYLYREYDEERYPRVLMQAKCKCTQSCIGSDSKVRGRCERVFTHVPVLYRRLNKTTNLYEYDHHFARVATGCTCARKRITYYNKLY